MRGGVSFGNLETMRYFWNYSMVEYKFGKYIYIDLRGQVKREHGVRCHLLPCIAKSSSGINIFESMKNYPVEESTRTLEWVGNH